MPDKYIVNMTEKTTPEDSNLLVIEDAADTKKITFANLFQPIKNMIGNLASLTTSHKSTLVGAVNEVHEKATSRKAALVLGSTSYAGTTEINKNANASSDSGTIIRDIKPDGSMTQIDLHNGSLILRKRTAAGAWTATTIASL